MPILNNTELPTFSLPGLSHQTLADQKRGIRTLEVWMQTIEPGAGTPVHRHDCEEVIIVLRGSGQVMITGETTNFGPNSTLLLPANAVHQIVNTGNEELFLVAALGMNPVEVHTENGARIPLPWQ